MMTCVLMTIGKAAVTATTEAGLADCGPAAMCVCVSSPGSSLQRVWHGLGRLLTAIWPVVWQTDLQPGKTTEMTAAAMS